ncbi:TPA: JAB domain-containing protein [Salmonella enterica]
MYTEFSDAEQLIIKRAIFILESKHIINDVAFNNADEAKDYLRLSIGGDDREIFGVLFLDTKHRLISFDKLFLGSSNHVSVHAKELAKAFMKHNASCVILAHNHPSGDVSPSKADILITKKIVEALNLLDGEVLDHIIVSKIDAYSFKECGKL